MSTLLAVGCAPLGTSPSLPTPTPLPSTAPSVEASPLPSAVPTAAGVSPERPPATPSGVRDAKVTGLVQFRGAAQAGFAVTAMEVRAQGNRYALQQLTALTDAEGRFILLLTPGTIWRVRAVKGNAAFEAVVAVNGEMPLVLDAASTGLAPVASALAGAADEASARAVMAELPSVRAALAEAITAAGAEARFVTGQPTEPQRAAAAAALLRDLGRLVITAAQPLTKSVAPPGTVALPGLGLQLRWPGPMLEATDNPTRSVRLDAPGAYDAVQRRSSGGNSNQIQALAFYDIAFTGYEELAADPAGNLWLSILRDTKVVRFPAGATRADQATTFTVGGNPQFVDVDAAGNAWFGVGRLNQVARIPAGATSDTEIVRIAVGRSPYYVVVDAQGNAWTANTGDQTVTMVPAGATDATGNVNYAVVDTPQELAVDDRGDVWSLGYHNGVSRITPGGRPQSFTSTGQLKGALFAPNGTAWFLNNSDNLTYTGIPKDATDDTTTQTLTLPFATTRFSAFDRFGALWVTDPSGGKLYRIPVGGDGIPDLSGKQSFALGNYPTRVFTTQTHVWVGSSGRPASLFRLPLGATSAAEATRFEGADGELVPFFSDGRNGSWGKLDGRLIRIGTP